MILGLCVGLVWLLWRSGTAMAAAEQAARLFATSVMPGLFPYMTLALMVTSRLPEMAPSWLMVVLGWCGGSPTGARLLELRPDIPREHQKKMAVTCATMSPMFLVGTIGQWTGSAFSGVYILAAGILGGIVTGKILRVSGIDRANGNLSAASRKLTLGAAVDLASRTMLMICGTMMLLRVAAELIGELMTGMPGAALALTTLLEVTSGTAQIAKLPLPLEIRTGIIAAATGFGGTAVLLQSRAAYPEGLFSLREQVGWQMMHGAISGVTAYLLMRMTQG